MLVYPIISWFQKCVAASRSLNKCICCLCLLSAVHTGSHCFHHLVRPFSWSPPPLSHPQPAAALVALLGGIRLLLEHSKRPSTRTSTGPFHFLSMGYLDATIQGMGWILCFFQGFLYVYAYFSRRYQGKKFAWLASVDFPNSMSVSIPWQSFTCK